MTSKLLEHLSATALTAKVMCHPIEIHLLISVEQLEAALTVAAGALALRPKVLLLTVLTAEVKHRFRGSLHLV